MNTLARTILTTLIAASFSARRTSPTAAAKKKRKVAPPSSYAPGPSNQRVYGAPIQGPIVTSQASRTLALEGGVPAPEALPFDGQVDGHLPGLHHRYKKPLKSGGANVAGNMEWKPTQVAKTAKSAAAAK